MRRRDSIEITAGASSVAVTQQARPTWLGAKSAWPFWVHSREVRPDAGATEVAAGLVLLVVLPVARPMKNAATNRTATASAIKTVRFARVQIWSFRIGPLTVVALMTFPFRLDHPSGDLLEFKVPLRSKVEHRETSSDPA